MERFYLPLHFLPLNWSIGSPLVVLNSAHLVFFFFLDLIWTRGIFDLNQAWYFLLCCVKELVWNEPAENEVTTFTVHTVLGKFISNNELETGNWWGSLSTKLGNHLPGAPGSQSELQKYKTLWGNFYFSFDNREWCKQRLYWVKVSAPTITQED